jgi:hypothetical protein
VFDQPHQRQRGDRLARARFADDGQRLAGSTWNDRLRTASTVRSEVEKRTLRSRTDSTRPRRQGEGIGGVSACQARGSAIIAMAARSGEDGVCGASPTRATPRYMPSVLNGRRHVARAVDRDQAAAAVDGGSLSITTRRAASSSDAPA